MQPKTQRSIVGSQIQPLIQSRSCQSRRAQRWRVPAWAPPVVARVQRGAQSRAQTHQLVTYRHLQLRSACRAGCQKPQPPQPAPARYLEFPLCLCWPNPITLARHNEPCHSQNNRPTHRERQGGTQAVHYFQTDEASQCPEEDQRSRKCRSVGHS